MAVFGDLRLALAAQPVNGGESMSPEESNALVRRVREEFISTGNMAVADEVLAPDFVYHGPAMLPEVRGREAFKQTIAAFRRAFPDLTERVVEQFVDGDRVISRFTSRGTFAGEMMGVPPTGRAYARENGIDICRLADGRVTEAWAMFDTLGMFQQIGLVPSPGQPGR
jgi:steroid delta-isomerase-like uncharacterized protein